MQNDESNQRNGQFLSVVHGSLIFEVPGKFSLAWVILEKIAMHVECYLNWEQLNLFIIIGEKSSMYSSLWNVWFLSICAAQFCSRDDTLSQWSHLYCPIYICQKFHWLFLIWICVRYKSELAAKGLAILTDKIWFFIIQTG